MKRFQFVIAMIVAMNAIGGEIEITDRTVAELLAMADRMTRRLLVEKDFRPVAVLYAEKHGIDESDLAFALLEYSVEAFRKGDAEKASWAVYFSTDIPGTNTLSRLQELAAMESLGNLRGSYLRSLVRKTPAQALPLAKTIWPFLAAPERVKLGEMLKNMKYRGHFDGMEQWDEYLRGIIDSETDEEVVACIQRYLAIKPTPKEGVQP